MKKFLEDATKLIKLNTVSNNGNEDAVNFLIDLMTAHGFAVQTQAVSVAGADPSRKHFNVLGTLGDPLVDRKIRKGLMLGAALDTSPVGIPQFWTETGGDPFKAVIKEDKIYGLGTAGSKLDFLCKLYSASKFRDKKLRMPIYLVGTCAEELGMLGARYLIKSGVINPKYVVIGEPTNLNLVYSHKALMVVRVGIQYQAVEKDARGFNRRIDFCALGKPAHAAHPHLGYNALLSGIDFLNRAIEAGFDLRFTKINGGQAYNVVPSASQFEVYLTSHQLEDFKRFFREYVQSQGKESLFKVEVGGLGGSGIRFFPDQIFPCLVQMIKILSDVEANFLKVKDSRFTPSHSTVSLGQIEQVFHTQGRLDLLFDLRLLPELQADEILKHIQTEVQKLGLGHPRLNLTVSRERYSAGLMMTAEHDLVRLSKEAILAAGIEFKVDQISSSTEAAPFFQAGYEAVAFGAGPTIGSSHCPNEHNILEQLEKASAFYECLIERTCL